MDKRPVKRSKPAIASLTVQDILSDDLTQVANAYWAPGNHSLLLFSSDIINKIYQEDLTPADGQQVELARLILLEISYYLENYLWKYFDPETADHAHIMSILLLVNEKFRQEVPVWDTFHSREEVFPAFLKTVFTIPLDAMTMNEKITYVTFLTHLYQSLEDPIVRKSALQLVSLPLWSSLSAERLQQLLLEMPEYRPHVQALAASRGRLEATFLPGLLADLVALLQNRTRPEMGLGQEPLSASEAQLVQYACRFLVLVVDLLAQLPTRRFFRVLLEDSHFYTQCHLSPLAQAAHVLLNSDGTDDENELASGSTPSGSARQQVKLFGQLLASVQFYLRFEIDEQSGQALGDTEMAARHYAKMQRLQRLAFRHLQADCPDLCLRSVAALDSRAELTRLLSALPEPKLRLLCDKLALPVPEPRQTQEFMIEVLVNHLERRVSQKQAINDMPLFPDEKVLFDRNLVPEENFVGDSVLALPKLNLQFLTMHDYLLRNFQLFRLESTYQIREDLVKAVERIQPMVGRGGKTVFTGWSRMAVPIERVAITQVRKPRLGDKKPSLVQAEITVDLAPFTGAVRQEWEEIRKHDVLFLLTMVGSEHYVAESAVLSSDALEVDQGQQSQQGQRARAGKGRPAKPQSRVRAGEQVDAKALGIRVLRGGEVVEVLDQAQAVVGERDENGREHQPVGTVRTYRLALDAAQYQLDQERMLAAQGDDADDADDVYASFNLLVRRKAKENNFKAVLETIRDLMNTDFSVPDWLHDVLLGYGDPRAAQYYRLPNQLSTIDFADTFLDLDHVRQSFPGYRVQARPGTLQPPFRLTFPRGQSPDYETLAAAGLQQSASTDSAAAQADSSETVSSSSPSSSSSSDSEMAVVSSSPTDVAESEKMKDGDKVIVVESYQPADAPLSHVPQTHSVRYTPTQVEAIRSGCNPGLTMVVGPPGTGKTDVAVQILVNLYQQFPGQRTLIVTHSNQALNDLFAKIQQRAVDERYLLRLGHGQSDLGDERDFSKLGRVNHMLQRRLDLLAAVAALARALGLSDDAASACAATCETAAHFRLHAVAARWEQFLLAVERDSAADAAQRLFPFATFLPHLGLHAAHGWALGGSDAQADLRLARLAMRRIEAMFDELDECRPFELLRSFKDRGDLLLTRHAKVIAMTCTHAALKRRDFIELGFQYDNIIMEESAQILEIETFIPMLLQNMDKENGHRLKRVILIGDHNQLPPVVKNRAFQKYSHLDQSMFTRLVRLGTPTVTLNLQGRARSSLSQLYRWRYKQLGDLPAVLAQPRFQLANAGFALEMQFINVEDFGGRGEHAPVPYFYQNLGEAEYVVQTFMLMRLLGYPAERISIITSYNGQKNLIRDVLERRCAHNPLFGRPARVTTVDKFQGQQNDYILLSLVRTRAVGHIRDVRRLVVAMSRARLGLYVFGRAALFKNCFELAPTFIQLLRRPTKLMIVPGETYPTARRLDDAVQPLVIEDVVHMGRVVDQMARLALQHQAQTYRAALQQWETQQRTEAEQRQSEASSQAEQADSDQSSIAVAALHAATTAAAEKGIGVGGDDCEEDEEDESEDAESPASSAAGAGGSKKRKTASSSSSSERAAETEAQDTSRSASADSDDEEPTARDY